MLSFAAVGPALAETIRIPYTKADLASDAGAAVLYEKIADAAKTLCVKDFQKPMWLVDETTLLNECAKESVAEAIAKTRDPALIGYHKQVLAAKKAGTVSATLAMR